MSDITLKTVEELSSHEKLELIQFSATSYYTVICKLLEMEVIAARDAAMSVHPISADKRIEQAALMTEAHDFAMLYSRFRKTIDGMAEEYRGELAAVAAQHLTEEREQMEQIVLAQASGAV